MTEILSPADLPRAAELLRAGELVAFPTETVYGLGADARNGRAVAAVFAAKDRPRFNPLICHMADLAMAERHAVLDPLSRKIAEAFWPGPLTLVLPVRAESAIHPLARAGLDTVGVRVPTGFASRLLSAFGRPLAAPSANTSGRISPTTARHVADDFGDRLELVLDAGPAVVGLESTILRVEGETIRLLRPGGLDLDAVDSQGYGFQVETAWRLERLGCPVAEVPITFVERADGRSKMTVGIVFEALANLLRWGWRLRLEHGFRDATPRSGR